MGTGATTGLRVGIAAASDADLKATVAGLSPELREKLRAGLEAASAPPAKQMANMEMGKWTDKETADMIEAILNQTTKGPSPELFRRVRPFHLPEYETKVALGQDAPDAKVFALDGTETTLLGKLAAMGHGPGKLVVLNFGSYTCPVHRGKQPDVSAVCKELSVDLLQVYILEAHPMDEWGAPVDGKEYTQTKSLEERIEMAKIFREAKGIKEEMVVDDMANPCNEAYEAVATRIYVLEGGKILWRTGVPPFQYNVDGLKELLAAKKGVA